MNTVTMNHLTKFYGKTRGTEDVTLELKKGEIFGFIGPNGAGKSTTIRCIMDLIHRDSGEIAVNGVSVRNNTFLQKEEIGYLPSEIHLYEDLTVQKMLDYSAGFYKKDCGQRTAELVQRLDLDLKKKINALSFGNLKKVGIVLAMMHSPKILIMDEASGGLDPLAQEALYTLLLEEKEKGNTVFYSSHVLSEIKRICDRVAIIKDGKIIRMGPVNQVAQTEGVHVTVVSPQVQQIKQALGGAVVEEESNQVKLLFDGDMNGLIQTLGGFSVDKLLIEALSLEDVFLHYYQ